MAHRSYWGGLNAAYPIAAGMQTIDLRLQLHKIGKTGLASGTSACIIRFLYGGPPRIVR